MLKTFTMEPLDRGQKNNSIWFAHPVILLLVLEPKISIDSRFGPEMQLT